MLSNYTGGTCKSNPLPTCMLSLILLFCWCMAWTRLVSDCIRNQNKNPKSQLCVDELHTNDTCMRVCLNC
eukprot:m.23944 g.23944  ORF g.23944 m.23944 type:complete len:70 (-) comp8546_c0_seq1:42-251(-)